MNFIGVIILAMIGEAVWETLKMTFQNGKLSIDRIGALVVSISLAFATGMDLFKLVGISQNVPFLGILLTGLLLSRGSNFMHDILESIGNLNQNLKIDKLANTNTESVKLKETKTEENTQK